MPKRRRHTVLALIALGIGALIAVFVAHYLYILATATPLHPDAQRVPSSTRLTPSPKWTAAVEQGRQLVRAGITSQNLPALSVAVGVDDEIVWAEAFGWADLDNHVPATPQSRFRIGSAAIPFTSVAVGLLLEQNRLKLDDEIQTYVREFPKKQWPVTLRQVMGHIAGISGDAGDEEDLSTRCERTADGLKRFADRPLRFEPGTGYRFSSYGWMLVSAAVEAAAGEPFFKFMRKQVFEPAGMNDTLPDSSTEPPSNRPTFYYPRFAGETKYGPELAREGDYACFAGAGAFLSTPSDLVRFGLAIESGKLLQPATLQVLQTAQRRTSGEETGYGLGWDLKSVSLAAEPTRQVGHDDKYSIGGSTSFITFPGRGIVVAVTSNTTFADVSSVASSIAQAFARK